MSAQTYEYYPDDGDFCDTFDERIGEVTGKKCALICVDEIIGTFTDLDPKLKYWKGVKQELKKHP